MSVIFVSFYKTRYRTKKPRNQGTKEGEVKTLGRFRDGSENAARSAAVIILFLLISLENQRRCRQIQGTAG